MTAGKWSFSLNNPTLTGLVTTAGYFIVFALCLWTGIHRKRTDGKADSNDVTNRAGKGAANGSDGGLWFLFAAFLFLLGLNKQLDLKTLLDSIGRTVLTSRGWSENRRAAQAALIAVFSLTCGCVIVLIVKKAGKRRGIHGITRASLVLMIFVIALRAGFMEQGGDTLYGGIVRIPHRYYSLFEFFSIFLAGLRASMVLVLDRIRNVRELGFDLEEE
jgi:hypothetical protein